MSHPTINQRAAVRLLQNAFNYVVETQQGNIAEAAELVAASLQAGGIIQVFGTGHSRSFAMEIAGRAGGLVPANKISLTDLVFLGGADPASANDPLLERDPSMIGRLLALQKVQPEDVFIICSNSGGNGSTVELALQVKEHGHKLIAVTSLAHTTKITSRHPSGKRLFELADVVVDNGGVYGDAALKLPVTNGSVPLAITPTSTVTSALIAQMLATEVCGLLIEAGHEVPVLISANIPGGDEHNNELRARYSERVHSAP
ncbi:MAG TPA: SIS domain-containing protein [Microlunatus sp.]|nr:SIS domain-containing protein [Microlunatus sp.]